MIHGAMVRWSIFGCRFCEKRSVLEYETIQVMLAMVLCISGDFSLAIVGISVCNSVHFYLAKKTLIDRSFTKTSDRLAS